MEKKWSWVISLFIFFNLNAQHPVYLVNQNAELIDSVGYTIAIVTTDNQLSDTIVVNDGILWVDFSFKNKIDIVIESGLIQTYHNQFTQEQFKAVDTIFVFQKFKLGTQLPVVLLNKSETLEMDNYDWFKGYFINGSFSSDQFAIYVYNTYKVTKRDKQKIDALVEQFCNFLMLDNEFKIIYTNKPYKCSDEDFFNSGSIITPAFIKNQNTTWMKQQALNYTIVLKVQWYRE